MVVFLDILIFENFIVNLFILQLVSQTVRIKIQIKNAIFAAALGSLYVITLLYPNLYFFSKLPFKLVVAYLMVRLSFQKSGIILNLKNVIIYILYSMLLAGICFFIQFNENPNLNYDAAFYNFSYKTIFVSIMICYLVIYRIVVYIQERKEIINFIYTVEIVTKGKQKSVRAFLDTGNELREPATNLPVMIVEKEIFEHIKENEEILYIPYQVVNGYNGKLQGFKPRYIKIQEKSEVKIREVVIACCENKLSRLSEYQALLSRGII